MPWQPIDLIGTEWTHPDKLAEPYRLLWTRRDQNTMKMVVALKHVPSLDVVAANIEWVEPEGLIDGSLGWLPFNDEARVFTDGPPSPSFSAGELAILAAWGTFVTDREDLSARPPSDPERALLNKLKALRVRAGG